MWVIFRDKKSNLHIDGLAQNCSNSIANEQELLHTAVLH